MKRFSLCVVAAFACLTALGADLGVHWILTAHMKPGWELDVYKSTDHTNYFLLFTTNGLNEPMDKEFIDWESGTNVVSYLSQARRVIDNAGPMRSPQMTGRQRPILSLQVTQGLDYTMHMAGRPDFAGSVPFTNFTAQTTGKMIFIDDNFGTNIAAGDGAPFLTGRASNRFYRISITDTNEVGAVP